jgi:hypothetical protein
MRDIRKAGLEWVAGLIGLRGAQCEDTSRRRQRRHQAEAPSADGEVEPVDGPDGAEGPVQIVDLDGVAGHVVPAVWLRDHATDSGEWPVLERVTTWG